MPSSSLATLTFVSLLAGVACASQKEIRWSATKSPHTVSNTHADNLIFYSAGVDCINLIPRASYYWSASQPGGNGGWPEYTHSMIVPSGYPYPASSYFPSNPAYPSYYPSASGSVNGWYPSASGSGDVWYTSASGSGSAWSRGPTTRPGSPSGQVRGQGQGQGQGGIQEQTNGASSGSREAIGAVAVIALGALTGFAAFVL